MVAVMVCDDFGDDSDVDVVGDDDDDTFMN